MKKKKIKYNLTIIQPNEQTLIKGTTLNYTQNVFYRHYY